MSLENFSWLIENEIAGAAHPGTELAGLAEIKALDIGALVTLTLQPLPDRLVRHFDLAYLHLPVHNFRPPTASQIRRFIRFASRNIEAGRPVLVHCLAGLGRTGTMLACYLVSKGMTAPEAIRTVRSRRPGSIETKEQERSIFAFAAELSAGHGPKSQ